MIELCTNMSVHGESDHNNKKLHNMQYVILCKGEQIRDNSSVRQTPNYTPTP